MHAYTGSFTAADGLTLFTRTFLPDAPAPAAVVIVHGYAEHSGRYEALAETLVSEGYAVYALDHRGHGQSGGKRASVRVFREYVDDLARFIDRVRETRPEPPRFLFGHSMGGLIALQGSLAPRGAVNRDTAAISGSCARSAGSSRSNSSPSRRPQLEITSDVGFSFWMITRSMAAASGKP